MSSPTSSSSLLVKNPPVVLTVGAVGHSAVLDIADHIKAIQSSLRTQGFPLYKHSQHQNYNVIVGKAPEVQLIDRWEFVSEDGSRLITINGDQVSYATTAYTSFIDFWNDLAVGLTTFKEVVNPAVCTLLGFRHINTLPPNNELISPSLHGLNASSIETKHYHHNYRFWCDTDEGGRLVVKLGYEHAKNFLPGNVRGISIADKVKAPEDMKSYVYVLDVDHSRNEISEPYEIESIKENLDRIHKHTNDGFLAAVTNKVASKA